MGQVLEKAPQILKRRNPKFPNPPSLRVKRSTPNNEEETPNPFANIKLHPNNSVK